MVSLIEKSSVEPVQLEKPSRAPKVVALMAVIAIVASVVGYSSFYVAASFGEWAAALCMLPISLALIGIVGGYTAAILFGLD
jgi:hypothetical protein